MRVTPEEFVEQLRAIRKQMAEVRPLTAPERKALRNQMINSNAVLDSSINIIDAHQSLRILSFSAEEVRALHEEADRWTAVEAELRSLLSGVAGANLVRRQRVSLLATQAYMIAAQLARDPANADLIPYVLEVKRLRRAARRRKSSGDVAPETPKE